MSTLSTTIWWDTGQENEYNWDISDTDVTGGGVLPELYGTMKVALPTSQIIALNVDGDLNNQVLSVLWALCRWNIDAYDAVRINGEPMENYPEVNPPLVYMGLNNQPTVADFATTKVSVPVGTALPTDIELDMITVTTEEVTGIGVSLYFPDGLYGKQISLGADDLIFATTVKVLIQYRTGGGAWTNLVSSNDGPASVSIARWSAGYCSVDPATGYPLWVEVAEGSSVPEDHIEGEVYDIDPGSWILSSYTNDPPNIKTLLWHWVSAGDVIIPQINATNAYYEINEQYTEPFTKRFCRTGLPAGSYEIRVGFDEAPAISVDTVYYYNTVKFDSYIEIFEDGFSYPNVALVAFKAVPTEQLNGSLPEIDMVVGRYYVYAYNPNTAAYEQKPATNPAWVCYDILHKCRSLQDKDDVWHYVVFGVPHNQLDPYWDLWTKWADWCDYAGDKESESEPYPDKKPYTFNHYFDEPISLQDALAIASACGRAKVRQVGINFKPIYEHPEPEVIQRFLFSQGNISYDSFSETVDISPDMANTIEVTYKEQGTNYTFEENTLLISWDDSYDISERDIKPVSVTLDGCTNSDMAAAYGKYVLNRNRYLSTVTSWTANVDSIHCEVGDIVEAPADFGGRLLAGCTAFHLYLDQDIYYEYGKTYKIIINHYEDDLREERPISFGTIVTGFYDEVYMSQLSRAPSQYSNYVIGEYATDGAYDYSSRLRRIISISRDSEMFRKIVAEEFNTHVFEDDSTITVLPFNPYEWRLRPPPPVITFNELNWKLDETKTWIPYINISVAADLSYMSVPCVKLSVSTIIRDGDTTYEPMGTSLYQTFDWTPSITLIEARAEAFNGKTIYLTCAYVTSLGKTGPKGEQVVRYIDTSFTPVCVLDIELVSQDYKGHPSEYTQYFTMKPCGWEKDILTELYAPILSWNGGTNYHVFEKYLIVYGLVATDGVVPTIAEMSYYTTPDIGSIYAADGTMITDPATLDTICRAAMSSSISAGYSSSKYVAITYVPITKGGASSLVDYSRDDYGLDWDWFQCVAPGGAKSVQDEKVTNFELMLSVQSGALFMNEMKWDYYLEPEYMSGFAIIFRAQSDWWFWVSDAEISATETSLENIITAIDFETGGGLNAVISWDYAYDNWVDRGIPYWYMMLSHETKYELIQISTEPPYAVTRGVESTIAWDWPIGTAFSYAPCELIDAYLPIDNTTQRNFILSPALPINFALHLTICAVKLVAESPGYIRSPYAFWDVVSVDGSTYPLIATTTTSSILVPITGADGQVKAGNHFVSKDFQQDTPTQWTGVVWDSTGLIAGDPNIGISAWHEGEQTVLINEHGISKIPAGFGISYPSADKPADLSEVSVMLPYGMTFPTDLAGSSYYAAAGSTAQVVVSIKKNGTEFATMTVATGATTAATWSATETVCEFGDRVSFVFPAQDSTWAGVAITLKGIR